MKKKVNLKELDTARVPKAAENSNQFVKQGKILCKEMGLPFAAQQGSEETNQGWIRFMEGLIWNKVSLAEMQISFELICFKIEY